MRVRLSSFFEVGFVGLWAAAFDYRKLCAGVTHPQPLSRGEVWDDTFLFGNEDFECCISPLEREDLVFGRFCIFLDFLFGFPLVR